MLSGHVSNKLIPIDNNIEHEPFRRGSNQDATPLQYTLMPQGCTLLNTRLYLNIFRYRNIYTCIYSIYYNGLISY